MSGRGVDLAQGRFQPRGWWGAGSSDGSMGHLVRCNHAPPWCVLPWGLTACPRPLAKAVGISQSGPPQAAVRHPGQGSALPCQGRGGELGLLLVVGRERLTQVEGDHRRGGDDPVADIQDAGLRQMASDPDPCQAYLGTWDLPCDGCAVQQHLEAMALHRGRFQYQTDLNLALRVAHSRVLLRSDDLELGVGAELAPPGGGGLFPLRRRRLLDSEPNGFGTRGGAVGELDLALGVSPLVDLAQGKARE